jgi:hypothetical protein
MSESCALTMWVIYDHPTDYPDSFVARLWRVTKDGPQATESMVIGRLLDHVRETLLEMHLTPLLRDPSDDAKIVEVWL